MQQLLSRSAAHFRNHALLTCWRGRDEEKSLKDLVILIKGAGEMATGVASRLFRSNMKRILMLETAAPLAVRRSVSFCEAVREQTIVVEGIEAVRVDNDAGIVEAWRTGKISVRVDPQSESILRYKPDILVDAILAKRNVGTSIRDAPLVIALGPGFIAGKDCHIVVETNRGHNLGRLITSGAAEANTGIPGNIGGFSKERVLRSPADGLFVTQKRIGDAVYEREVIGHVGNAQVYAEIDGILRGLIKPNCSQ